MDAFDLNLSHFVNCLADTCNLTCNVVLVINTLAACHLDGLCCSNQLCLCSSLITGFNSCETFLIAVFTEDLTALFLSALVRVTKILFFADLMLAKLYTSNIFKINVI